MQKVALITKHHKAQWIAPVLKPLGYDVIESDNFDTDTLGTFAGEIERILSPKEAALTKAKKACELTQTDWGLGSEGSFGGGPAPGLINWNDEILCMYQASTNTEIYAHAGSPTSVSEITTGGRVPVNQKLLRLPGQHWIVRTDQSIEKGLSTDTVIERLTRGQIDLNDCKIEPDLRAMHCPQRQKVIAQAAQDLAMRLSAKCPKCQAFNFVVKEKEAGLPCAMCTLPTQEAKAWIRICETCNHRESETVEHQSADPGKCQYCNP